jgi:hypothetical protein
MRCVCVISLRLLLLAVALVWASAASPQPKELDKYSFRVVAKTAIKAIAAEGLKQSPLKEIDSDALILALGYSTSNAADDVLVELLDFYLGESHFQAISHVITRNGNRMKLKLEKRVGAAPSCLAMTQAEKKSLAKSFVRCLDREARDKSLKQLIDLIDRGVVVEYVF